MNKEQVLKLAGLARIEMDDAEAKSLAYEFDGILDYVGEIKGANLGEIAYDPISKNVMRQDADPHESGLHTETLLAEAPAREGGFVRVKKIL